MIKDSRKRVAYLIGAGASHGCVKRASSQHGIQMRDLALQISEKLREVILNEFPNSNTLKDLANSVINENTDFEQVITFLDDSPSRVHREFADKIKSVFQEVLTERLNEIREELGEDPIDLYAALFDMYEVSECPEVLMGIMTLNYDEYIERASEKVFGESVDFGFKMEGIQKDSGKHQLLKLHGSLGWEDTWPTVTGYEHPLWIPPGIQKSKQAYPFNVLWGLAREMLTCDILRIIGCRLGSNDWDLISLLFTTRHVNDKRLSYEIEIIDSPANAARLQREFPYLAVKSILEIGGIGKQIIGEFKNSAPTEWDELTEEEQNILINETSVNHNWFAIWLEQMAEMLTADLVSVSTKSSLFERLLQR